jgi:hypothetical protein
MGRGAAGRTDVVSASLRRRRPAGSGLKAPPGRKWQHSCRSVGDADERMEVSVEGPSVCTVDQMTTIRREFSWEPC